MEGDNNRENWIFALKPATVIDNFIRRFSCLLYKNGFRYIFQLTEATFYSTIKT